MVSDVSADIAPADTAAPRSSPQAPAPPDSIAGRPTNKLYIMGLFFTVALVVFGLMLASSPPTPDHRGGDVAPTPSEPPLSFGLQSSPPPPIAVEQRELRPPVQSGQRLTENQLRYCMAESIRIDATKTVIDTTSPRHVEFYNAAVQDWISRCDSVQYTHEDLEAVTEDMEARRPALRSAGRKRFIAWRADMLKERSLPTATPPDGPQAESPAPPGLTQPAPGAVTGAAAGATVSSEQFATASDDPTLRYAAMLARGANIRATYPKAAVRRREQGAVEIHVTIGSDGALKEAVVLRSSGFVALDEAALSAIAGGTDLPPVPGEFVGREFSVSIPFDFRIADVAR